jgi:hypothetical protein
MKIILSWLIKPGSGWGVTNVPPRNLFLWELRGGGFAVGVGGDTPDDVEFREEFETLREAHARWREHRYQHAKVYAAAGTREAAAAAYDAWRAGLHA